MKGISILFISFIVALASNNLGVGIIFGFALIALMEFLKIFKNISKTQKKILEELKKLNEQKSP